MSTFCSSCPKQKRLFFLTKSFCFFLIPLTFFTRFIVLEQSSIGVQTLTLTWKQFNPTGISARHTGEDRDPSPVHPSPSLRLYISVTFVEFYCPLLAISWKRFHCIDVSFGTLLKSRFVCFSHAFSSCHLCNGHIVWKWSLIVSILTHLSLSPCSRSPDMLQSEVSFSMGGRHSSTDSNKASSGDLSPYDNNSPVLSERSLLAMQENTAPEGSEKLYKGPEQYTLVGHLPSLKSRESSPGPRLGKGNYSQVGAGKAVTLTACGIRPSELLFIPFLGLCFCNSVNTYWIPAANLSRRRRWGEPSHCPGGSLRTKMSGKHSHAERETNIPSWLFSFQHPRTCVPASELGCIFASLRCHPIIAFTFIKRTCWTYYITRHHVPERT